MPTSLRDVCTSLARGYWGSGIRLPQRSKLDELAANLPEAVLTAGQPRDIVQLAREICECIDSGSQLSRRQVREASWCLWHKDTRLAQQPVVLNAILEAVSAAARPSAFNSLATAFADYFDQGMAGMDAVSSCLQRLADRWDTPWARLHRDYSFFDARIGPDRLAAAVIAQDRPAPDIIRGYDIGTMGAKGGYVRAVTISLLDQLANGGEPNHLLRLEKVERYALGSRGEPSFDGMLGKIAEALLKPFGQSQPERTLRDRFLSLLLRLLGDPRLKSHKHNWLSVPDTLVRLVRSWLSEQSLRQFLDVVDEISDEKMWDYRRAFWEGIYNYYKECGVGIEAWVAFGKKGSARARQSFGDEATFATLERLSTSDKYVSPEHAVLLIRIGDVMVTDWNQNGKCHIWSSCHQDGAPILYKNEYDSREVQIFSGRGHYETDTELSWGHGGSETLSWQSKIAGRLERLIGIEIPQSVYRL